jgi:hypothetical protein
MLLLLQIFWVFTLSGDGGPASQALMQGEAFKAGFLTRKEFGG